jgi:hypothetical protein
LLNAGLEAMIHLEFTSIQASFYGGQVSGLENSRTGAGIVNLRHKIFYRPEYESTSEESATFRRAIFNLIIRSSGQILTDLSFPLKAHNLLKK